jgi:hypothetical protein
MKRKLCLGMALIGDSKVSVINEFFWGFTLQQILLVHMFRNAVCKNVLF